MSQLLLSALTDSINKKFEDRLAKNINRATVVLQLFGVKDAPGDAVKWVATFGTAAPAASAAVISDGTNVSAFNSDTKVPASLSMGTYHDAFGVEIKSIYAAAAAGNPAALVPLLAEEMEDSANRLAKVLAQEFYSGDGTTNHIIGLCAANGGIRATGIYAGINRATYSQWGGTELANGGVARDLSIKLLRDLRKAVYVASGRKITLWIGDPTQHEKYAEILDEKRRYVEDVTINGRQIKLDGGFQMLSVDGAPFIEDVDCPSGRVVGVVADDISFFQIPQDPAKAGAEGMTQLRGTEEAQFGEASSMLKARAQRLAVNGDMLNISNFIYPAVRAKQPFKHGQVLDLTS